MERFEIDLEFEDKCTWNTCDECIHHYDDHWDCSKCDQDVRNFEKNFMNYLLITLTESKDLSKTELERLKFLYEIYKDAK